MSVLGNRAHETSQSTGDAGNVELDGPVAGKQSLVAAAKECSGDAVGPWVVAFARMDGTDWEVGTATLYDSTPDYLTYITPLEETSNAGSRVDWGVGTTNIILAPTAAQLYALLGALTTTGLIKRTGADAYAIATLDAWAEANLLPVASASAGRTVLGAGALGASIFQVATEAALQALLTTLPSTGDVKLTLKASADTGWVMMDDGTIGDASSGATTRANADCEALFTLLWTNISDTWCPVSGGRGGSAAADWAAHKTITLPLTLGRALAISGSGSGLTARALGENLGAESHSHTGTTGGPSATTNTDDSAANTRATATHTHDITTNTSSSMQPTSFLNVMIKL